MDDLLETMDTDPDYTCYTLDAQTSFMDDYFDVKPQNEKKFGEYVKAGKLPIGPWYVQPDEHLPTAEGIIRNMLISKKLSDRYADYNRVGYVPDSFGQSSTMPTLLKGFLVWTVQSSTEDLRKKIRNIMTSSGRGWTAPVSWPTGCPSAMEMPCF